MIRLTLSLRFWVVGLPCVLGLSGIVGLGGCTPFTHTRGYIFPLSVESKLHVGMDQDAVLTVLGSPVLVDPLDSHRWIYTQTKTHQQAFQKSHVVAQKTLVLSFNAQGSVDTLEWVPSSQVVTLIPDPEKTPVLGRHITPVQQMFQSMQHIHKKDPERSDH